MLRVMKKISLFIIMAVLIGAVFPGTALAGGKVRQNVKKATLTVGETYKLKLIGAKGKIKWKSSKKSVVSVNSKGKIRAKKKGKATVTATNKGKKYKFRITVKKKVPESSNTSSPKTTETPEPTNKPEDTESPIPTTEADSTEPPVDAISSATQTTPSSEPENDNTDNSVAEPDKPESEGKTLVVYFSRTGENYSVGVIEEGNTAIVAGKIASKTGADTFEILAADPYPSGYEDCKTRATSERSSGARPEYIGDVSGWSEYDRIFIGYPIWWGDMPMIVYNFIEKHDWSGKTVIPFNTHEGSGQSGTQSVVASKCSGADVKQGIAIRGSTAQSSKNSEIEELNTWLSGLGY